MSWSVTLYFLDLMNQALNKSFTLKLFYFWDLYNKKTLNFVLLYKINIKNIFKLLNIFYILHFISIFFFKLKKKSLFHFQCFLKFLFKLFVQLFVMFFCGFIIIIFSLLFFYINYNKIIFYSRKNKKNHKA